MSRPRRDWWKRPTAPQPARPCASPTSGRDDVPQLTRGADGEIELLAGLARMVVDDLGDQPAHRAGGDHLDIGGDGGGCGERGEGADQARETTEHDSPCPAVVSRCAPA